MGTMNRTVPILTDLTHEHISVTLEVINPELNYMTLRWESRVNGPVNARIQLNDQEIYELANLFLEACLEKN